MLPDIEDETNNNNNNNDVNQQTTYDALMRADLNLQRDNQPLLDKVKGRHVTSDSIIIGHCNDNQVLNILTCDVEFPDG